MANNLTIDEIKHFLEKVSAIFVNIKWQTWGEAALYIIFGFLIASFVSSVIGKVLIKHTSAHYTLLIRRLFYYGILALSFIFALAILGVKEEVLGIATIFTLALGFASKTAVSNIISGLFLVFEKPFVLGDYLELNDIYGEVLSIDLLSIKIRTRDNTLVHIPNEILLNAQFKKRF